MWFGLATTIRITKVYNQIQANNSSEQTMRLIITNGLVTSFFRKINLVEYPANPLIH